MNTFSEALYEQCKKYGKKPAIVDKNSERTTTYEELFIHAKKVRDYVLSKGIKGIIPIFMERTEEYIASIIGINLAGLAVAPLSSHFPAGRLEMIKTICKNDIFTETDFLNSQKMTINENYVLKNDFSKELAYVVFTSGSTGMPKGVMINNESMIKAILRNAGKQFFDINEDDLFLNASEFSFIVFVGIALAPLYSGAVVHILPDEYVKDINEISKYINRFKITKIFIPPQLLREFPNEESIKLVCIGGDKVLSVPKHQYRLLQLYGLSETVEGAFSYDIVEDEPPFPIGVPHKDFRAYIIDEAGNLVNEGELCISGYIADGYLNLEEQTKETFTENIYNKDGDENHKTLLHTRDIVKKLPNGNYIFVSRKGNMVKINGQRVDIGEIEYQIMQVEDVKSAVVKAFTDDKGKTDICAYYTINEDANADEIEKKINERLNEYLPQYMIPKFYEKLDKLPLNQNGKIDRLALKLPDSTSRKVEYEAPQNETEDKICKLFEEVLGVEKVGRNDDFFLLGGDSILQMELTQNAMELGLTTGQIMKGRTPKNIAKYCNSTKNNIYENLNTVDKSPLTDSQMGIYLQCMNDFENTMYNIPIHLSYKKNKEIDINKIKDAINKVANHHPALLAHIEEENGKVYMLRSSNTNVDICEMDNEKNVNEEKFTKDYFDNLINPFDLKNGPLIRAKCFDGTDNIHVFMDMHHIVSDGTSVSIITHEINQTINNQEIKEEIVDAFSLYEIEEKEKSAKYDEAKIYFEKLVSGNEADSNLIFDKKIDSKEKKHVEETKFVIDKNKIENILKGIDITESSFFMSAFSYTLSKMTAQKAVLFTMAENGRKSALLCNTVAMMVKILPISIEIDEENDWKTLASKIQAQVFESIDNDIYSFGDMAREFGIKDDVSFAYQSKLLSDCEKEYDGLKIEAIALKDAMANLKVTIFENQNDFTLSIEYCKELYEKSTIDCFANMFKRIVDGFCNNLALKQIALISEEDKEMLDSFNQNDSQYDTNKLFLDYFDEAVKKNPNKNAVIYMDDKYTYKELDDITNKLAQYISSLGIGKNQTVSILIPRCKYMVSCAIGVMKSGALYQPLDPTYPIERLKFMCDDAQSKLLITNKELVSLIPDYKGTILFIDEIDKLPSTNISFSKPSLCDPFVILYTSGTTGTPKGVLLSHSNLVALLYNYTQIIEIDENSNVAGYASYGFDAHMADIYPALYKGGTDVIVPEEIRLDLPNLKVFCESLQISQMVMTTQVGRQFLTEYDEVKGLKYLLLGGEKLVSFEPKNSFCVVNAYGPSECTLMENYCYVDKLYDNIPIGKALMNTREYVIDSCGRRLPVGVPGELVISGPQVGIGYLNQKEKTEKVFVKNSFDDNPTEKYNRCYLTGDIVRYIANGDLEFIGRRDMQVKIRGFRIELDEVEKAIREYPGIKDATVVASDIASGGKCINAYIVSDEKINIKDLNDFIKKTKPPYMVPANTMQIEEIPLNANLKVDKRKLPKIENKSTESKSQNENVNRELTIIEKKIIEILTNVLGDGDYDIYTTFEDMGVTSISSIKVATEIYNQFNVHITSKDILGDSTITSVENIIIDELLKNKTKNLVQQEKKFLTTYPLTQTQIGVYVDCLKNGVGSYYVPILYKIPSNINIDRLKQSVKKAIEAHPSLLCNIHTDQNGDINIYPDFNIKTDIEEETVDSIPPKYTEFQFNDKPLFKFRILKCKEEYYLFLEAHHIIIDGESYTILLTDIKNAYVGKEIEKEKFTAFDLSVEEASRRSSGELIKAKSYYDSIFRGLSCDYIICSDRDDEKFFGEENLPIATTPKEVQKICREYSITENVFFTTAFAITLARYTSHEDALFATIHNGRTDPRFERLVSMLVKTLPVYVSLPPEKEIKELLLDVQKHLSILKKNDIYSFADAAKDYMLNSDVMFVYQGKMLNEYIIENVQFEEQNIKINEAKAEISFEVLEKNDEYLVKINYNGGRFSRGLMISFADAYATCVRTLLEAKTIADVEITSDNAIALFNDFNDTHWDVPFKPAYRLLEDVAKEYPERTAVIDSKSSLTFDELNSMANTLAWQIINYGIPKNSPITVITNRTKEAYLAHLGILKAACPFLFLSPEYPDDRISFVLDDASVKAIITTHDIYEKRKQFFDGLNRKIFFADDIKKEKNDKNPSIELGKEDPVYIIYTSGSTGKPKGVILKQKGLVNYVHINPKNPEIYDYTKNSAVCSAVAAFTFDASIMEEFGALANGRTVSIASEEDIHNPASFVKMCIDNKVESVVSTPSFVLNLLDAEESVELVKQLKFLGMGGEAFPTGLWSRVRSINPNIILGNCYGPTEATVSCTYREITSDDEITIGKPLNNVLIYIIDKQNHILPKGALGEMVILGEGIAEGYINRDDLNKKVFFELNSIPAYKSGDLALINHQDEIMFHGRIDNQVKLRGLRVELGEIENAIDSCDGVKKSVVIVSGDEKDKYLVAYYTVEKPITEQQIIDQISQTLTPYMVPHVYVELDAFPLTANGKIDKKALPEPTKKVDTVGYVAPSTEIEKLLCEAFEKALSLDKVGIDDDFFKLGGTSLTATRVAMYTKSKNIPIVYADIFTNPTVRELAKLVETSGSVDTAQDATRKEEYDYTKINAVLQNNIWNVGDKEGFDKIGNVLFTGATGFLGMHVFKELVEKEEGNIYCLLRKGAFSTSELKLMGMYIYYFDDSIEDLIGKKIHCIDADITDDALVEKIKDLNIDTVINCAAVVKHFSNSDDIMNVNVHGVENLVNYCKQNNKKLIHISTVSVAGEGVNGQPPKEKQMKETEIFFNQVLENKYIISKFDSERVVLEAVNDGLNAKIFRVGNLMPRYSDGEFQINNVTNGFMRTLRGYYVLGCCPYSILSNEIEFSPIDETAKAIIKLAKTDKKYNMFHCNNVHRIFMSDVIKCMNDVKLTVEIVEEEEFVKRLNKELENSKNDAVSGLIAYLNRNVQQDRYFIDYDNSFTSKVLNKTGFSWNITDEKYIENALICLRDRGFFDLTL